MKHLLTILVLFLSSGLQAQQEWFLKKKPLRTQEMGWAQRGGVAFSLGDYIIFGMGYDRTGYPSGSFKKYDPTTNTFSAFAVEGETHSLAESKAGEGGVGFSIGDIGYVGLGGTYNYDANDTIFQYTLAENNFWNMQPLVFPGGQRIGAIVFVIGDKAYIGGGANNGGWQNFNDLWEYSPTTGWAQRANMPANIDGGVAFALDGKGYVISKTGTALWSYDPVADAWSVKAPYPGGVRDGAAAFTIGDRGYVGTGSNTQDFFAYEPASDSWTPAPALWAAAGRDHAVAVSHGTKAYLIGGYVPAQGVQAEIWELGPSAPLVPGTWAQRPYLPGSVRRHPVSFTIDDILYLGGGIAGVGNRLTDLWSYAPITRTWTARAAMPTEASVGVEAAAPANGKGYILTASATDNFWAYDPVADTWAQATDLLGGARTNTVAFGVDDRVFISTGLIGGVRQNDLWAYDPQTNAWEQRVSPGMAVHSSASFVMGGKGCISAGNIAGSSTATDYARCYDPATDSWAGIASFLAPNNMQSHMAFGIGDQGFRAGGTLSGTIMDAFHSYNPVTDAWTIEATTGGGFRVDGTAASAAGRGFLSCGNLNQNDGFISSAAQTNDLWEYIPWDYVVAPGVSGTVYYDADEDCTINAGDVAAPYKILKVQPGGFYTSTDQAGNYFLAMPVGQYTLEQMDPAWGDHCDPSPRSFEVLEGGPALVVDFPDTITFGLDVGVALSSGVARRGSEFVLALTIENNTPLVSGAVNVQLILDPNLTFTASVPPPTSINGNTIVWDLPQATFTNPVNIQVSTQVPNTVGIIGTQLVNMASITCTEAETVTANNTTTNFRTVTGPWDPNDKVAHTSSGSSDVWLLGGDEFIDYTIRFQNTGNDTAFTVVVTDTLPQNLEPGSIVMGAASHPFTWKLSGHGTLEFTFANILLPDSNVNEAASHGFVSFRIKPRTPLLPGTTIENIANIYFDFNEPVITEPSVLVAEFSTGLEVLEPETHLYLYPNPALHSVSVGGMRMGEQIAELRLLALDGRILRIVNTKGTLPRMDIAEFADGLYIVQAVVNAERTYTLTFIKH